MNNYDNIYNSTCNTILYIGLELFKKIERSKQTIHTTQLVCHAYHELAAIYFVLLSYIDSFTTRSSSIMDDTVYRPMIFPFDKAKESVKCKFCVAS